MQTSSELETMIAAARLAGRGLLDDFAKIQNLADPVEDAQAFVASADKRAAEVLGNALAESGAPYGMLMEGAVETEGADRTRRWIVDPMDGTANFQRGMSHWAVSIALEKDGEIVAAVVYDPVKDEAFTASKGAGAWLNGKVRLGTSGKSALSEGMLATGMPPGGSDRLPDALIRFERLLRASAGVRQWGAAALDLAYVAAGRLDGYWNRNLAPWHFAAGLLLVREAGGKVAPLDGEPHQASEGDLIGISSGMLPEFNSAFTGLG